MNPPEHPSRIQVFVQGVRSGLERMQQAFSLFFAHPNLWIPAVCLSLLTTGLTAFGIYYGWHKGIDVMADALRLTQFDALPFLLSVFFKFIFGMVLLPLILVIPYVYALYYAMIATCAGALLCFPGLYLAASRTLSLTGARSSLHGSHLLAFLSVPALLGVLWALFAGVLQVLPDDTPWLGAGGVVAGQILIACTLLLLTTDPVMSRKGWGIRQKFTALRQNVLPLLPIALILFLGALLPFVGPVLVFVCTIASTLLLTSTEVAASPL